MTYKPDITNVLYLTSNDAEISSYKRCIVSPVSSSESIVSASAISSSGSVLIQSWITDELGITSTPYANWNFNLYASVDDNSGSTNIGIDVYKSNTQNVESYLFGFSINDINDLTSTLHSVDYNPNVLSLSVTDRLVFKLYLNTDSAFARTIYIYSLGIFHQSRIIVPFDIMVIGDMQKIIYNPAGDGISKLTVGTAEPISPMVGDLWIDIS